MTQSKPLPKYKIEKLTEGNHSQVFIDELRADHNEQPDHNKYDEGMLEVCTGNAKEKMADAKRIVNILSAHDNLVCSLERVVLALTSIASKQQLVVCEDAIKQATDLIKNARK